MSIWGTMKGAAIVCLIGPASMAQDLAMHCEFVTECLETDACQATSYEMEVEVTAGEPPFKVRATTVAETMQGDAQVLEGGLFAQMMSNLGPVMLTIDGAGNARQSIHSRNDAMMVSYSGTCKATN